MKLGLRIINKPLKMILQDHPKQGDTYKGYTIKGFHKKVNKRRGYVMHYLYLENDKGTRRVCQYKPNTKEVRSFEMTFSNISKDYPTTWYDCDLNKKSIVR
tara:strand:- start:2983 stop:3285 length:303 start_codon:yes stop_codon:yes gene_type:complete